MADHETNTATPELAPCPFCGSTDVTLGYDGQPAVHLYMVCRACKAQGPSADFHRGMTFDVNPMWNRRALAAPVPAAQGATQEPDPELQQKIQGNRWDHLSEVMPVLKAASAGNWQWYCNSQCKYVELRIDMRSGHCIIRDRERNRILPKTLAYQLNPPSKGDGWPGYAPESAPVGQAEDAVRQEINLHPSDYLLGVCSSHPHGGGIVNLHYATLARAQEVFDALADAIDTARTQQAVQSEPGVRTMADREQKLQRVEYANALIKVIGDHGRRFWNRNGRRASMELDARGRVWWNDEYTGARIYTHDAPFGNDWNGWSHGGTLKDLAKSLRDYIRTGRLLHPECIAPGGYSYGDLWGYGPEAAASVRAAAHALPMFKQLEPAP